MLSHDTSNERFLKLAWTYGALKAIAASWWLIITLNILNYYLCQIKLLVPLMSSVSVFARHGIPFEFVSDNMPFLSNEFITFANSWSNKTATSSQTYS